MKDHTPSLSAEGGVKIKHTPIPPRAKEVYQADLAESALPATAHWYACGPSGVVVVQCTMYVVIVQWPLCV